MVSQKVIASSNLKMLEFAARKLGPLRNDLVFLGGCTTALFISDPLVPDVRATLDVDCIVEVASRNQYRKLEAQLTSLGFVQSIQDDVICRWHFDDLILDVMPTDKDILGFSNCWYQPAIKNFVTHEITQDLVIKSITAPYFLATKFEAFFSRGKRDFLASHDFEDIITVIDGRSEILNEISLSEISLKKYLTSHLNDILDSDDFYLALPGHLNYGSLTDDRTKIVLNRIKDIVNLT